ncbi:MAG: hypothetical protein HQ453_09455 [Actinobacteria bacterium]|nr:hypothetical protein [Actinomycetota bacterium]
MLSGSCFFHRANQGTGLGVQAGIGNFVVRIVPFVTPWIIGFALVVGTPQVMVNEDTGVTKDVWFQNAGYVRTRPLRLRHDAVVHGPSPLLRSRSRLRTTRRRDPLVVLCAAGGPDTLLSPNG